MLTVALHCDKTLEITRGRKVPVLLTVSEVAIHSPLALLLLDSAETKHHKWEVHDRAKRERGQVSQFSQRTPTFQ